jgi:hypothetical protein
MLPLVVPVSGFSLGSDSDFITPILLAAAPEPNRSNLANAEVLTWCHRQNHHNTWQSAVLVSVPFASTSCNVLRPIRPG